MTSNDLEGQPWMLELNIKSISMQKRSVGFWLWSLDTHRDFGIVV